MEKARLFIALDLDDFVVDNLVNTTDKLREVVPNVKWFNESTIHLTLKFFGNISLLDVREIDKSVRKSIKGATSFSFETRGIGGFPTLEKPRVFWAGVDSGKNEIEILADNLDKNLQESFGADVRKFVPHITIGRTKRRIELSKEQLHELNRFEGKNFGVTTVNKINLYSSELTPVGPVYSKINSWEFEK